MGVMLQGVCSVHQTRNIYKKKIAPLLVKKKKKKPEITIIIILNYF